MNRGNSLREQFKGGTGVYKRARFGEVVTAMVTPFHEDGALDLDGAQHLADYLQRHGSQGLVIAGTTGESPTLRPSEQLDLFRATRDAVDIPILAGTGSNNTAEATELTQAVTDEELADAILAVSPYYNRPPQAGIEDYFRGVAGATDLPVVVYDIPGRTGRKVASETILKLAIEVDNIVGLKDAAGDTETTLRLIKELPEDFVVYSGDDGRNLELALGGGVGAISVASHWGGEEMAAMYAAVREGDSMRALLLNGYLQPSYEFETSDIAPNPIPTKIMMAHVLGVISTATCRSPMVLGSPEEEHALTDAARMVYNRLHSATPVVAPLP